MYINGRVEDFALTVRISDYQDKRHLLGLIDCVSIPFKREGLSERLSEPGFSGFQDYTYEALNSSTSSISLTTRNVSAIATKMERYCLISS